ncbi:30775_t:CDS:2, partial [Racocetra persica]
PETQITAISLVYRALGDEPPIEKEDLRVEVNHVTSSALMECEVDSDRYRRMLKISDQPIDAIAMQELDSNPQTHWRRFWFHLCTKFLFLWFDDVFEGFRSIREMEAEMKPLSDENKTNLRKLKNRHAKSKAIHAIHLQKSLKGVIEKVVSWKDLFGISDEIQEMYKEYIENFPENILEILL